MKRSLLFVLLLYYCFGVYGQEGSVPDLPNIISPAPTAYELTKHGNLPIGMFTGTPNVNIPLHSFSTRNITVPISLSYSSNGIKVDQLSSNVGLGWSLNVGGVISRIVRGKEDENSRLTLPIKEINRSDLYIIEDLPEQTQLAGNLDVDPDIVKFIYDVNEQDDLDSQSDLFSYNILGMSGQIVMNEKGELYTVPHTNLKVEFTRNYVSSNVYSGKSFKITASDGVVYYFSDMEVLYSRTKCNGPVNPPEIGYTTAWYITKISHPNGDEVNFFMKRIIHKNSIKQVYHKR